MPKPTGTDPIRIRGARQNNLKNLDLDIPARKLVVITGLSGSGKSSLAFDTLFAEGQRRYVETFSPYARQFFDRMDKPAVDSIEGIPPAIAIEQRNAVRSTRSTVGTMTEVCDYMKVLWPYVSTLYCRTCGEAVRKDSPHTIWEKLTRKQAIPDSGFRIPDVESMSPFAAASLNDKPSVSSLASESAHQESGIPSPAPEVLITFRLALSDKLAIAEQLALVAKQGFQRLLIGGQIVRIEDAVPLIRHPESGTGDRSNHGLTVVQDRIKLSAVNRSRFHEACEQAFHFGHGKLAVHEIAPGLSPSALGLRAPSLFSSRFHCAACDLDYREPSPALFSFNHPVGACPECKGFGRVITIDYDLAIPDRSKSLADGAVKPWQTGVSADCQADMMKAAAKKKVPTKTPFRDLSEKWQRWVIDGDPGYGTDKKHEWPHAWYGVKGYFRWLESKSYKMHVRVLLSRYRAYTKCHVCDGKRLQPDALLFRIGAVAPRRMTNDEGLMSKRPSSSLGISHSSLSLSDFYLLPIRDALAVVDDLAARFHRTANDPLSLALKEVRGRLGYLAEVGLGYLTLDRSTRTLSGGETARVNLTTCLGSRLVNTLFVLDEPSVGLHPRDTDRLVKVLQRLRDQGNTVVVVEHESNVMRAADQIIDLGPGHGASGGDLIFQGTLDELLQGRAGILPAPTAKPNDKGRQDARPTLSLTAEYLSGRKSAAQPRNRPVSSAPGIPWLLLRHATRNNLADISVDIPLRSLICVSGVSGSGKSTLIREILLPLLEAKLGDTDTAADEDQDEKQDEKEGGSSATDATLSGHESLGRVVLVDQTLLGRTPRSNPAVYIGAFEDIREIFAQTELAKQRGLNASAFSFNSGQGQCERCRGAGFEKIEMQFLSDVFVRCPDCNGRRYREHILEVKVASERSHASAEPSPQGDAKVGQRILPAKGSPSGTGKHRRQIQPLEGSEAQVSTGQAGSPPYLDPASGIRHPGSDAWSIADLLDASVDEAILFLDGLPDSKHAKKARTKLALLQEVGLGYLRVGQPINTLSGGESQRLKLVSHLAEFGQAATNEGKSTLFLFDEPTTGLHFEDVRILIAVFQRLVDAGHSVLIIEHNLDVIRSADWVIDLGPEAGDAGGRVIATGTSEQIATNPESRTGQAMLSDVAKR